MNHLPYANVGLPSTLSLFVYAEIQLASERLNILSLGNVARVGLKAKLVTFDIILDNSVSKDYNQSTLCIHVDL